MKLFRTKCRKFWRAAFTLAEMLVVLVILSILALVAVQSLGPVAQQARIEATQKTLTNVRNAILGIKADGSGTGSFGFVADYGRLPVDIFESDNPSDPTAPPILERYLLTNVGGKSPLKDAWENDLVWEISPAASPAMRLSSAAPEAINANLYVDVFDTEWKAKAVNVTVRGPFSSSMATDANKFTCLLYKNDVAASFVEKKEFTLSGNSTTSGAQDSWTFGTTTAPLVIGSWTLRVFPGTLSNPESELIQATPSTFTFYEVHFNLSPQETRTVNVSVPQFDGTSP